MSRFFRVDDRLIHGQTLYSWIPYLEADSVLVISDKVDGEAIKRCVEVCETCENVAVAVKGTEDAAGALLSGEVTGDSLMVVVEDLAVAVKLYRDGVTFDSLNLGNIHHSGGGGGGRKLSESVIVDSEDERCLEELSALGVSIDIRDVPSSTSEPCCRADDNGK